MTSTPIGVDTKLVRVRVIMRDSRTRPTPGMFGAQFQNLESLLFVCALIEAIRREQARPQVSQEEGEAPWHEGLGSELSKIFGGEADPLAGAVSSARQPTRGIRVERVTYRSPVQIILGFFHEDFFGLAYGVGGTSAAFLAADRAIKLWERISHARLRHTEANRAVAELRNDVEAARSTVFENRISEAEARIREAEARVREAEAKLRASEVDLEIAAHDVIRSEPDLLKALYSADLASAQSGVLDPQNNSEGLMLRVGQATKALASIDDIGFISEDEAAG